MQRIVLFIACSPTVTEGVGEHAKARVVVPDGGGVECQSIDA